MKEEKRKIDARVYADGVEIDLNAFVNDFMGFAILGMVESLKGADHPKEVEIRIKVIS